MTEETEKEPWPWHEHLPLMFGSAAVGVLGPVFGAGFITMMVARAAGFAGIDLSLEVQSIIGLVAMPIVIAFFLRQFSLMLCAAIGYGVWIAIWSQIVDVDYTWEGPMFVGVGYLLALLLVKFLPKREEDY